MVSLGPGTLVFSTKDAVPIEIDASCLVNNARIEIDKEQDDARTKLCGTTTAGKITYTYKITGNLDTDVEVSDGLFAFSHDHAGETVGFEFTPNTEAGTSASGDLTMDPLSFGADEYGDPLDSDFELTIVGKPDITFAVVGP